MIAAAFALLSSTPDLAGAAWLAGHWQECSAEGEASETWSDGQGGVMLGLSKSTRNGSTHWEFSRIDKRASGLAFFASPKGQPPAAFAAVSVGANRIVFEDAGHDFPQRVIYSRAGDRLTGRIEGMIDGKPHAVEWHYQRAKLNAACPPR